MTRMPYTKRRNTSGRHSRLRTSGTRVLMALSATLVVFACGESTGGLLNVVNPNAVAVSLWQNPANATLMVNSVIGDFECAFGGFVMSEGMASDELKDASFVNLDWNTNRRDNDFVSGLYGTAACTTALGLYTPMSTAREEGDSAIIRLGMFTTAQVPNRNTLMAEANLYTGFSYAALGMSMCQAAFDLGPLVDQEGMFAIAESRMDSALAYGQAAGLTNVEDAAYGVRARVRLFQHNLAGAIADAQLVPSNFVFNAAMDATNARRYNHVFQAISTAGSQTVDSFSVALKTENGQLDPRAAVVKLTTAPADGRSTIFIPTKYNAASLTAGEAIPMPVVRYAEAQLILAEAQGGAQAVGIINTMRAAASLQPYTGPTDATSITNLIAGERQRVLFLEGFRSFDIERLNQPLVPPVGYPYFQGGTYGATVCLPLPLIETLNNPNIDPSKLISGVQGEFPVP